MAKKQDWHQPTETPAPQKRPVGFRAAHMVTLPWDNEVSLQTFAVGQQGVERVVVRGETVTVEFEMGRWLTFAAGGMVYGV